MMQDNRDYKDTRILTYSLRMQFLLMAIGLLWYLVMMIVNGRPYTGLFFLAGLVSLIGILLFVLRLLGYVKVEEDAQDRKSRYIRNIIEVLIIIIAFLVFLSTASGKNYEKNYEADYDDRLSWMYYGTYVEDGKVHEMYVPKS